MADNTCQKAVLHRRQTQGPRILADPDAASQECLGEYVTLFYHSFEKPSTSFWDKGDVAESFLKMTHQLSPKTFPRMTASEVRNSASGKACWCAFSYVGLSCVLCFQWLNPSTRTSLMVQRWATRLPVQEVQVQCLSWEHPLEEEMATHSSALAWEIPWTEEHGGLYSPWVCKRVRHDFATNNNNTPSLPRKSG